MPIDVTDKYIRARVRMPNEFQEGSFRTIDIDKAKKIKAVIGRLKGKTSSAVQSYLFDKKKWTIEKVRKWIADHGETIKSIISNIMPIVEMAKTAQGESYEKKALLWELKEINEEGEFDGFGATNKNIDHCGDRFIGDPWSKTIQEKKNKKWPLLWSHRHDMTIGSFTAKSTTEGLFINGKLNLELFENGQPKVPEAHKAHSLYKNGHIDGLSVGYRTIKTKFVIENDKHIREILEAKLYEVSMVPVPMSEPAIVTNIKGIEDFIEFLQINKYDENLKNQIISLYWPQMEPDFIESTLKKAAENYFSADEIAIEEPEQESTLIEEIEPKIRETFYQKLQNLRR